MLKPVLRCKIHGAVLELLYNTYMVNVGAWMSGSFNANQTNRHELPGNSGKLSTVTFPVPIMASYPLGAYCKAMQELSGTT
jgi:hypothetical protein